MKKSLALLATLLFACSSNPFNGGQKIVSVNGTDITEKNLEFLGSINPNIARQLNSPFGKKQIIDNLIEQELLYQAAKKDGLQREKNVQEKIKLYQKVILAQSLIENEAEIKAREEYEATPQNFERLRLGMIEILFDNKKTESKTAEKKLRSEKEAAALAEKAHKEATAGKAFAELAAEYTDDVRGQKSGGDQGFVTRNETRLARRGLQPVLDKAFQMKVGNISEPIKTENGYYLITMTAPMERLPFEQVKGEILYRLLPKTRDQLLIDLKGKARINYAAGFQPKENDSQSQSHGTADGHNHDHNQPHHGEEAPPSEGK